MINHLLIVYIFSSKKEDRHGDVVIQDFDLKSFKKNPVILNSHNYGDAKAVIGKAIPKTVKVVNGKLQGTIKFAVDENPDAKIIFGLYAGGYLNAFSIGFMPLEFDDKDWSKILKSELLEVSAVSVPANPDALAKAKAKGIDVDKLYVEKNIKDEKDNGKDAEGDDDDNESGGEEGNEKNKGSKITKEFEEWENGTDEIRLKIRDIAAFEQGSFERTNFKDSMPIIQSIIATPLGDIKKKIQSLIFPKSEGWNLDDAKKFYSSNQATILNWEKGFTSAKPKTRKELISCLVKVKEDRQRSAILKAKVILEKILNEDVDETNKKRKLNQAVRKLIKAKGIK